MTKSTTLHVTLLLFVTINLCRAQNMVPNPSFENYSNTFCGIQVPTDFNQIMIDWENPTLASPQVFFTNIVNTCYNYQPFSLYSGPIGIKGNQSPRTGNAMVGLWSFTIPNLDQRQYVQAELTSPMITGNTYVIEFYVSLADSMELSIDKIGAYLSVNKPAHTSDGPLNYTPQVLSSTFVNDVSNWVLISDTIVAQDAYSHITIGNFYDDNSTNTMANSTSSGAVGTYGAFYFVDDVRIEEINTTRINDIQNDKLLIYPTNVTEILNLNIPFDSWVEIHNCRGQLIYSQYMGNGLKEINMSNFSKGIYIVSVQNGVKALIRRIVK
ncbi:MAG TPA: T9SS type A sorting domain-containing protein [Flavobacteriales bacterium]|nr:T9SS type A sorting domain-containing protein [Flavobacteriales bacterium]HIN38838.1 T9SS type A sorting domain-containing protein [Flavobacteriales bacterium]